MSELKTEKDLLPCPFCGNQPKLREDGVKPWGCGNWDNDAWSWIHCEAYCIRPSAHASVPWRWRIWNSNEMFVGRTKEEAATLATQQVIEKWNRRTPIPNPVT